MGLAREILRRKRMGWSMSQWRQDTESLSWCFPSYRHQIHHCSCRSATDLTKVDGKSYVIRMLWDSLSSPICCQARSATANMCGGFSSLRRERYWATIFGVYIGNGLYGLSDIKKRLWEWVNIPPHMDRISVAYPEYVYTYVSILGRVFGCRIAYIYSASSIPCPQVVDYTGFI